LGAKKSGRKHPKPKSRAVPVRVHDLNSGLITLPFGRLNVSGSGSILCITRLTVTVKVEPAGPDGLRPSFETANGACDGISEQAWHPKTFRQLALDKGTAKSGSGFGLSAQMAVRAIAKRVDAYALDKRTKRMMFRKDGAFPYDERIRSWDLESETVWLWRVAGRRRMPLEGGERRAHPVGAATG
jgi:hypothetical protein